MTRSTPGEEGELFPVDAGGVPLRAQDGGLGALGDHDLHAALLHGVDGGGELLLREAWLHNNDHLSHPFCAPKKSRQPPRDRRGVMSVRRSTRADLRARQRTVAGIAAAVGIPIGAALKQLHAKHFLLSQYLTLLLIKSRGSFASLFPMLPKCYQEKARKPLGR